MAKLPRAVRSFNDKKYQPLYLALIGIVVAGGAYSAVTMDMAYSAKSLMAAASGALDKTPRVEITRSFSSPTQAIWPNDHRTIAVFTAATKNVKNSTVYLTKLPVDISVNKGVSALRIPKYSAKYSYCTSSVCNSIDVPLVRTSEDNVTYHLTNPTSVLLPMYENPLKPSTINVMATSYYPTYYHSPGTASAAVKADVGDATATSVATAGNKRESISVNTNLAYGSWLTVRRGIGYGYGYFDYNNDGYLTESGDVSLLQQIVTYAKGCVLYKMCDVNGVNGVNQADVDLLRQKAGG